MFVIRRCVCTCRLSPPLLYTSPRTHTLISSSSPYNHTLISRTFTSKPRYLVRSVDQNKTAIKDPSGDHSFEKLSQLSTVITDYVRATSVRGARVALLMPPCMQFAAAMIGVMNANCVPVPLNHLATDDELEYVLNNSEVSVVLTSPETDGIIDEGVANLCVGGEEGKGVESNVAYEDLIGGIMVYTSGTTGRPKGVLSGCVAFKQWTSALAEAWQITSEDSILHTLPLYHIHGIMGIFSVLSVGGTVDLRTRFEAGEVWSSFLSDNPPSLFYGVPTQYSKLISHYNCHLAERAGKVRERSGRLRLMVSGSAPLRDSVSGRWEDITGHRILERYGMTEVGMVISNPYEPVSARRPGCIGLPLSGVQVRIMGEDGEVVAGAEDGRLVSGREGVPGEIQIAGPTLFNQYYNRKQETEESFTTDGWFKTGDTADIDGGVFRILGRTGTDIIKSGGYKLSALEIERVLLDHANIVEVAVIGLDDETWGERVVAVIETDREGLETAGLRAWCNGRMSGYKVPKDFVVVEALPRNHMGKVNKKALIAKYSAVLR